MNKKILCFLFSSTLFSAFSALFFFADLAHAVTANITQINFTNAPQIVEINTLSARLTTQTQNSLSESEQLDTSGTVLELTSSSGTGEFYNANSSACTTLLTPPFTLSMSSGSANKNFCYKDSTAGTHTLTITAEGKSWTAATQSITINPPPDTTPPTITLTGANPQVIEVNSLYSELGATVSDNVDTGLTATIDTTAINVNVLGSYSVKYNVSDSAGNAATEIIRTIQVTDTTKPVITLTGNGTINLTVGDTYTEQGATASDNYDSSVTITISGDTVNSAVAGTYNITYNATDSSGNAADQVTRQIIYAPATVSSGGGGTLSGGAVSGGSVTVSVLTISPATENPSNSPPVENTETSQKVVVASENPISEPTIVVNTQEQRKNIPASLAVIEKENKKESVQERQEILLSQMLTATAADAESNDTSDTMPIVLGSLSLAVILVVWKLKFMS